MKLTNIYEKKFLVSNKVKMISIIQSKIIKYASKQEHKTHNVKINLPELTQVLELAHN